MPVKEHKSEKSGMKASAVGDGDDKPPVIPLRAEGDDASAVEEAPGGGDDKPPVIK
jgi:hypothetical protein